MDAHAPVADTDIIRRFRGGLRCLLDTRGIQALATQECLCRLGPHDRRRYGSQSDADIPTHAVLAFERDHGGHSHRGDVHGTAGTVFDIQSPGMGRWRWQAQLHKQLRWL